ncbi:hypothetical protein RB213_010100 [Colletotrichum asianum]
MEAAAREFSCGTEQQQQQQQLGVFTFDGLFVASTHRPTDSAKGTEGTKEEEKRSTAYFGHEGNQSRCELPNGRARRQQQRKKKNRSKRNTRIANPVIAQRTKYHGNNTTTNNTTNKV